MQVAVLGPVSVDGGRIEPSPRDRTVLSALAACAGETVSPDSLAAALWGDDPPASWSKVVAGCVMRLRRLLGVGSIETHSHGYRFTSHGVQLDSLRFTLLVANGHELVALGEPDRAAHLFTEALALWRGQAFSEAEDWEPARIAAARLQELRLDTEEALVSARMATADPWELVAEAQSRVAEAPLREHRWALLARAQYRNGQQGEALATLRRARTVIAGELGLDLGPELIALEASILQQDASLLTGDSYSVASAECPYFGLVSAGLDDADLFFGREEELRACLAALAERGALVVVGPSGAGKSSFALAGIGAALRADGREVRVVTPGAHPMTALDAVPAGSARSALIVDQCEEALLLCEDSEEQERFFTTLAHRVFEELVVVTLRADRLGDIVRFPEFAHLTQANMVLLGPLTTDGVRDVIQRPAREAGLLLEPGLVDLLLRDVDGEPGALPLLSYALRQTWVSREGRTLTVEAYRESGGIRGAVARSAELLYQDLRPEQRGTLRDVMLRLIEVTPDATLVPLRVPREVIAGDPARNTLIEQLLAARLLTSDDGVVEMAHEALAHAWPRLSDWLDDDLDGQRILRHLGGSAIGWNSMGRLESELYRGPRLSAALDWRQSAQPDLTELETAFLAASEARERDDLAQAEDQLRRERRTIRRLRWLTAAAATLAVVALVTGGVAVGQRDRADERSVVAEARRVAARALVERPYDRALLLAVEAVHLWDSPETRGNLLNTIGRSSAAQSMTRSDDAARILNMDLSMDGSVAAAIDSLEHATLYDLEKRRPIAVLAPDDIAYLDAAMSPDGARVVLSWINSGCWTGDCRQTGIEVRDLDSLDDAPVVLRGFDNPAADIAFSPDGLHVAAIAPTPWFEPPGNVAVWRVDQPTSPVLRLDLSEVGLNPLITPDRHVWGSVAFSPDGSLLYASGYGPTSVYSVSTGKQVDQIAGMGLMSPSPSGRHAVVAAADDAVEIVELDSPTGRVLIAGHSGPIMDAAFNADGTIVATAGSDQTVMVWDAATGEPLRTLTGHVGVVHSVAFGPDDEVVTAGADGAIMRWSPQSSTGLSTRMLDAGAAAVDATGTPFVSPGGDRLLLLGEEWANSTDAGTGVVTMLDTAAPGWGTFLAGGSRAATVGFDGLVTVWDLDTGEPLAQRQANGGNQGAIAATSDGDRLIVVNEVGDVRVLDSETLELVGEPWSLGVNAVGVRVAGDTIAVTAQGSDPGQGSEVIFTDTAGTVFHRLALPSWSIRGNFSQDGSRYAAGGFDGRLTVIDVETGAVSRGAGEPIHDGAVTSVVFSPDGTTLLSMGFDGEVTMSNASDGVPYARFSLARPSLFSAAAFLDNGTVVIGLSDGSLTEYSIDPEEWEAHACAVAGRDLTTQEWRDAFGEREYRATCSSRTVEARTE